MKKFNFIEWLKAPMDQKYPNGKGRIEVWFNNGLFRAFPDVEFSSIRRENGETQFVFGNGHSAIITDANTNFMEFMYEEN